LQKVNKKWKEVAMKKEKSERNERQMKGKMKVR
jgi:hypothetical protein